MTYSSQRSSDVLVPSAVRLGSVYADAALSLVPDNSQAEQLADELQNLVRMTDEMDGLDELFETVSEYPARARELVEKIFTDRSSDLLQGLLVIMAEHGRLGLLRHVARQFRSMLDSRQGKLEITLTAAAEPDADTMRDIGRTLREMFAAEPILKLKVDQRLLGGMRLRVGDRLFDASIATQLDRLREKLILRKRRLSLAAPVD